MKEYGGYIEFEYFHGEEYHNSALALNSGSHCAEYLIRAKNIKKLYLPYYMCGCLKEVCDRLGVAIEYYHTDFHFHPVCDNIILEPDAFLYIVNYYGQLPNETLCKYKKRYGSIIVDNAQAFFQLPIEGVDTIYTCRKFLGVSDGAYLYTDAVLNKELEQDTSYDRLMFLFGRQEFGANAFYSNYVANEDKLSGIQLKRMSVVTQNLLRGFDYSHIKDIRTDNFACLHELLGSINALDLKIPDGAYMYPLYLKNGQDIRKRLQLEKLYIPTLWPDVLEICSRNMLEYDMARNILPLPVDQRYTRTDMHYIAQMVQNQLSKDF